jgi:predicted membrane protein
MKRSDGFWWGGVLIALGVLLLMENLDIIRVGDVLREYWPGLLVLLGIWVILRGGERGPAFVPAGPSAAAEHQVLGDIHVTHTSDIASYSTVFGDSRIMVESRAFRGGTLSSVFGDCTLDCSHAEFAEGDHTVRVSGVFGDVTIILPPGTAYTLGAHTLFGGIDAGREHRDGFASTVNYQNAGYEGAQKRVRLELSGVFGDILVSG